MRMLRIGFGLSLIMLALAASCQTPGSTDAPQPEPPDGGATYQPTPYKLRQPANFPALAYALDQNPLTVEGVELGRALFYDPRLSRDSTVSCAFCHQQFAGFGHSDHALSHGIDGKFGTRNVPGLFNLGYANEFFWDGGIVGLDNLAIAPLEHPAEMDLKFPVVLDRVRKIPNYRTQFKQVFGTDSITSARFLKVLSQFMLTLVSADSRYDKVKRNEAGATLTTDEQAGLAVFQQKCATCHADELFTDHSYRNNGLAPKVINDLGRARITLNDADNYKFKVPSLRNVERTLPYMHDGRFTTLAQVLDHYDSGVQDSPTLDARLRQPNGRAGIPLTATEKRQLQAFLLTLTDATFLSNPQFSQPK